MISADKIGTISAISVQWIKKKQHGNGMEALGLQEKKVKMLRSAAIGKV